MTGISYKRHRFPLMSSGGLAVLPIHPQSEGRRESFGRARHDVSYETVRCWADEFGRAIASNIRRSRPRPGSVWHLDEMVVRIRGTRMFIWRAVGDEGEVLDVFAQKRRNKHAALRLIRKLLKKQG